MTHSLSFLKKKKKKKKAIYCQRENLGLILFVLLKDESIVKRSVGILFTIFCSGFNCFQFGNYLVKKKKKLFYIGLDIFTYQNSCDFNFFFFKYNPSKIKFSNFSGLA